MNDSQDMDVDMDANNGGERPGGVWSDYNRNEPPSDANWNDLETIICHQMKKDVDEKCKKLEFFRLAR